jgi:predicted nucleotidyltransferase component of viral defense system
VPVASVKDLMAMKLKVLAERGELRDYYDVMQIDQHGGVSVEDGVAYYLDRYRLDHASDALAHLIRALGYLEDADEDEALPVSKAELAAWWRGRQAELIRNLGT